MSSPGMSTGSALQHSDDLHNLLTMIPAFSLAERLSEPAALVRPSCCQVAARYPDSPSIAVVAP